MMEVSSPLRGDGQSQSHRHGHGHDNDINDNDKLEVPYVCDAPGCFKRFKRSDRLLRHKKNHENITPYPCTWPGCEKSFVRKDVRLKHLKRHLIKEDKLKLKQDELGNKNEIKFFEIYTPDSVRGQKNPSKGTKTDGGASSGDADADRDDGGMDDVQNNSELMMTVGDGVVPDGENVVPNGSSHPMTNQSMTNQPMTNPPIPNQPLDAYTIDKGHEKSSIDYVMNAGLGDDMISQNSMMLEDFNDELEMPNLIEWLLNDNQEYSDKYLDYSPSSSFKDLLGGTPDFIYSTSQSEISPEMVLKLTQLIPTLQNNPLFDLDHIEKYLDNFWCLYHIQFPIIHRPTFSTDRANPLLVLSMITIGASLSSRTTSDKNEMQQMIEVSEAIAQPLRWLICSSCEELPTVSAWIIQSLLILECFEITCSNRRFHRRAHLHHGFKIELLRRSPLLGGDPLRSNDNDNKLGSETGAWENWIELESLKRCAYIAFLVDTYNGIIFGHDTILYSHHIKLSLPASEELWEMASIDKTDHHNNNNLITQFTNEKFLSVITNILRRKNIKTSPLISKILLAGLISLVFQTEQNDMQSKSLQWKNLKSSWKNDLLATLDYWFDNVIDETCCQLQNAYYCPADLLTLNLSKPDDTTCKFSVYHISQAFLRLSQYDCIIYAGAPTRMNVKANSNDYQIVQARVKKWAHSFNGKLSVTHAYIFLCEILMSQDDDGNHIPVTYDPNKDPIFYRPNIVASALFLIWDYNYCLYGAEAEYFNELPIDNNSKSISVVTNWGLPEKLNGYTYLQRIRKRFDLEDSRGNIDNSSKKFKAYAGCLDEVTNKHYTVGLLRLLKDRYSGCNSQVCREYGKLMENCIQRSLGKREILCANMYEE